MVLQTVPLVQKNVELEYRIQFDYSMVNEIMLVIKQCQIRINSQELQLFCSIHAGIPKNKIEQALYKLQNLQNVEVKKIE